MGILRFRVAEKQRIEFGKAFVKFIRGISEVKITDITYSNATGQSVVANQVLHEVGTVGTDGYIQVKSTNTTTLNGSGLLNLTITHQSSSTQANQTISFPFDNGTISIDFAYNSKPETEDINRDLANRATYVFDWTNDFKNNYSDYDLDEIDEIAVFGDVTGFELSGIAYLEGTWVTKAIVEANEFKYKALNQDAAYETDNTWKAKDINGNISN